MSKSVLISIHPEWCEKIASGRKIVEIRKTRPKIDIPFKCYIYQTKHKWMCRLLRLIGAGNFADQLEDSRGKVIGEFICDAITEYVPEFWRDDAVYNAVWAYDEDGDMRAVMSNEDDTPEAFENSICMDLSALKKYIGTDEQLKPFYGWHISDLVIYDKPKLLHNFYRYCKKDVSYTDLCLCCKKNKQGVCKNFLTRPPQSWCYVEEL